MSSRFFFSRKFFLLILLVLLSVFLLSACQPKTSSTRYVDVYLDCENYSLTQNDPGNCQVVPGTSNGLRLREGMVVSKEYVDHVMGDLGWQKISQTQKFVDYNGASFRVEVYRFQRTIKQ